MNPTQNADHCMEAEMGQPRTIVFSQRNLTSCQPFRCAHFEFEDVISQVDRAVVVTPRINPSTRRQSIAKALAYHTPLRLNPGVSSVSLGSEFELFFAVCGNPTDLLRLHALGDWRNRCRKAICLIDEVWAIQVWNYRNYLRMLDQFDHVFLYQSQSVAQINELIGATKCSYLPPGVDTIRFCPYPHPPERVVDIYSIGRRSEVTHRTFLGMAAQNRIFYLHDSTFTDQVLNPLEHRTLFANIAKRSRYFIVNPGSIDRPDVRGSQIEFGSRYFEGAASGSILLGHRPQTGEFERLFDWPGALIDLTYDSPNAEVIIKELDQKPEEQIRIQRMNIQQSLLRHDWAYRWEEILKAAGLDPLPRLASRKEKLQQLADVVIAPKTGSSEKLSPVASGF